MMNEKLVNEDRRIGARPTEKRRLTARPSEILLFEERAEGRAKRSLLRKRRGGESRLEIGASVRASDVAGRNAAGRSVPRAASVGHLITGRFSLGGARAQTARGSSATAAEGGGRRVARR